LGWVGLGWNGFIGLTVKSNGLENDRFSAYLKAGNSR